MHAFLLGLSHLALLLVVGGLVGLESLGLPLPGETVLIAGVLAGQANGTSPWLIFAVATVGAIIGDNIGYLMGRLAGVPILEFARRRFPRAFRTESILRAAQLLTKYGAVAIFFARFVALLRLLSGPLAGTLRFPYRWFFVVNAAGAVAWAGTITLLVSLAGHVAKQYLHTVSLVALAVAIVAIVVTLLVRMRHRATRPPADPTLLERPLAELLAEVTGANERQPSQ